MAIELIAETRTDLGKGASRRLRHAEKMPGILYGAGSDPVSLTFEQKDIRAVQDVETFYSSILNLKIDGGKAEKVILRDMQHHPFKTDIMHIDLQRVDPKSKMHIHVPLHFINESKSPGVKHGGLVSHVAMEVEVECLPKDIPEFIEVDLASLGMGESIHLSEMALPEGVELMALKHGEDHDTAVVAIHAPKGGGAAADDEGGEEAGEE